MVIGDDGVVLTDGLGAADGLAVAELPELCCADTTPDPQPAASAAASTSTDSADDRPRITGLRSNKGTNSPDTSMSDRHGLS